MANQEHLDILKRGVDGWNQWWKEHTNIRPNLTGADLRGADLRGAFLTRATLSRSILIVAHLQGAHLSYAYLDEAILIGAHLQGAHLDGADLCSAYLTGADLRGADLSKTALYEANLSKANLGRANLREANLSGATLSGANLSGATLTNATFSGARIEWTVFGNVNLSTVTGLDTIHHSGPSTIGIDTIYDSHGNIPEAFLRQAGVQETFLTNMRALVDSMHPIDFYSCFISYSSKDQDFAERLYADLQGKGVRCWFAPEDLKIGEKFWHRIDESIRLYDKLLVVLSQHSVESEWVEREVIAALEKERQQKKLVLFPITLDEVFKHTFEPWAADLRRQRHIGDFTCWKDYEAYQKVFNRLLRDLKA